MVPERHPITLAKEIATMDHYSGGRFLFGIGTGWLREETEMFGVSFKNRVRHTRECVLAMKQIWTKDVTKYHGEFIDFPPIRCFPKPVQKPYPPVLLGSTAPNVLNRVVSWADGWAPTGRGITPDKIREARRELNRLAKETAKKAGI